MALLLTVYSSPAIAPGPVTSIAAVAVTTSTIQVTYSAPIIGGKPSSYQGYARPHGGSGWTLNAGTFSSSGGAFVGLAAGTSYDLQIVTSNTADTTASAALTAGISTTAAAGSTYATTISAAGGVSGSTFAYVATPAGAGWTSGAVITPSISNGTASPSSAVGSGSTPVSFTVTATGAPGTNCIVDSSASAGMTNLTGGEQYAISQPSSLVASRYDIVLDQSLAAAGASVPVSLYFNAAVPGSGTITLTGNGTFSPSATVTLGGQSGQVITGIAYTPSAAAIEHSIGGTNSAGLHDPYPAPLTVASANNGTAATLSIAANFLDRRTFQKDTWSGAPTGFTATGGAAFTYGWGEFWIGHTPAAASGALYGRLTDADSSGATSSGGGTIISNIAQIYGAVTASQQTSRVLLPSSDYDYYLDVATDAAFTHPVRIAQRFSIRDVLAIDSRSMECMWLGCFPYSGPPGNTAYCAYTKTTGIGGQNESGGADTTANAWVLCDGVQSYGAYGMAFGSVGAQEAGRMWHQRKGHGVGIAALAVAAGNMDEHLNADGSPKGGFQNVVAQAGNKFRYFHCLENGWSGLYATESYAEYQAVMKAHVAWLKANYPALAVISYGTNSGTGMSNGSTWNGYVRLGKIIADQVEPTDPMVIATDAGTDWDYWYSNSGHAAWESQVRFVRAGCRAMFMAEHAAAGGYSYGLADRFVTFGPAATMASGSGIIQVPFALPAGASNLVALKWTNGIGSSAWTYTTPSAAELAACVAIYAGAGSNQGSNSGVVAVLGVSIDNTAHVLNVSVAASTAGPLTAHVLADFPGGQVGQANATGLGLFDNRTIDDCGYGVCARSAIDIAVSTV